MELKPDGAHSPLLPARLQLAALLRRKLEVLVARCRRFLTPS